VGGVGVRKERKEICNERLEGKAEKSEVYVRMRPMARKERNR
jgi:hypothetical protein